MNKLLIELITCESGDWEVLRVNLGDDFKFAGHRVPNYEWVNLLDLLGFKVKEKEISDEDMENENY